MTEYRYDYKPKFERTIAPYKTEVITHLAQRIFRPWRVIANREAFDCLLVDLIVQRRGKVAQGQIRGGPHGLRNYASQSSPLLQIPSVAPGDTLKVVVTNPTDKPVRLELELEGRSL